MSSYVVKRGYCSVKEDGLRSFIWSKRWLLLREQTLTFHRNENTYQALALVFLKEIEQVNRIQLKPYCLEIITKDKSYYISCKSDEELYAWIDELYQVYFIDLEISSRYIRSYQLCTPGSCRF